VSCAAPAVTGKAALAASAASIGVTASRQLLNAAILQAPVLVGAPPPLARKPRLSAVLRRGDSVDCEPELCIDMTELGGPSSVPVPFVFIDTTGDGQVDAMLADTDGDGRADTLVLDTSGNGTPDTAIDCLCFDMNGDGLADIVLVDTTDDGHSDTLIRIFSHMPMPSSSVGPPPIRSDDGLSAAFGASTSATAVSSTASTVGVGFGASCSDSHEVAAVPPLPLPTGELGDPATLQQAAMRATVAFDGLPSSQSVASTPGSSTAASMNGISEVSLLSQIDDDVFSSMCADGLQPAQSHSRPATSACDDGGATTATGGDSLQLPLPLPLPAGLRDLPFDVDPMRPQAEAAQLQHAPQKGKSKADANLLKHGWTPEEDETIVRLVQLTGQKWSYIANALPGRTDDAVRNRYLRLLKKKSGNGEEKSAVTTADLDECQATKKGDMWTAEEDTKILDGVRQHGFKWQLIAGHLPGRSANAVRNRYLRCAPAHGDAGSVESDSPSNSRQPASKAFTSRGSTPPMPDSTEAILHEFSEQLDSHSMNVFWDAAALYGEALESIQDEVAVADSIPFPT